MALQLFKIETVEVASPVSSITFSGIPQGYTDLKLVLSSRSNYGNNFGNPRITINSDTSTSSFGRRSIYAESGGTGSEVGSETRIIGVIPDNATANVFGSLELYIPNYAGSAYKSYFADSVTENNATSALITLAASSFTVTSAITSIAIVDEGSRTFQQYTTATLYGIKNS
jgi:hypothetical protein